MIDLDTLAAELDAAASSAMLIDQPTQRHSALTLADAYEIQRRSIDCRRGRGERMIGVKMGFTSRAKMVQMGLSDLIWGRLTDAMMIEEGGTLDAARFIHPRVEPELAILLKRPLSGLVSTLEAWQAVGAIAPALEIIDSRYRDFKFTLADVVADNASSSAFAVGAWQAPDVDISNLGMVLSIDGKPVQFGSTAAILGHPIRSLVAAARLAGEAGLTLEPGWIVMLGGATSAEPISGARRVRLETQGLGCVDFGIAGGVA
jgi:2-oxo-3-hexenedioate decarboxylase